MESHRIVSRNEWIEARIQLLKQEKELTRLRDQLSAQRRDLPWVHVEKDYAFEGPKGKTSLIDLFGGKTQLIVQHFMFGPDWDAGCKSCSFWADNFDGIVVHLQQRDIAFAAVSQAPFGRIEQYRKRMGWDFNWVSCFGSDFNHDCNVSFTPEEIAAGEIYYNYTSRQSSMTELPGISVFATDVQGNVFHTYSCYERGLDMMNAAYHYIDLVPKGRDEASLSFPQAWVRRHDEY
jgi:predicted dithiol-disulfide oxidoreductase (DUF899 family)